MIIAPVGKCRNKRFYLRKLEPLEPQLPL
jgi:hypothetical protein